MQMLVLRKRLAVMSSCIDNKCPDMAECTLEV